MAGDDLTVLPHQDWDDETERRDPAFQCLQLSFRMFTGVPPIRGQNFNRDVLDLINKNLVDVEALVMMLFGKRVLSHRTCSTNVPLSDGPPRTTRQQRFKPLPSPLHTLLGREITPES